VFDVNVVLRRIEEDAITMLPGPPALYQSILLHPERGKFDISSLRLAVTGAAAIPVELIHRMKDDLGFETVITAYGLTESCGVVTMCRLDDDATSRFGSLMAKASRSPPMSRAKSSSAGTTS
jgi:acyl-CoA synthetase (AMP-forming)/AMP-acid ligase II